MHRVSWRYLETLDFSSQQCCVISVEQLSRFLDRSGLCLFSESNAIDIQVCSVKVASMQRAVTLQMCL